ncbi:MAG TPA: DUF3106 domain-containing protein [Burkholderiales bacterium]
MAKALAALTLWLCIALSAFAAAADKKQLDWPQLTPEQQQILAPLSSDWNNFDDRKRKKWLLLAKRYPKMKPEAQQRLQTQMKDWAKLTPEQRRIARENYKKLAKQPPEKREAVKQKWQEHQQRKEASSIGAPPAPATVPAPAAPGADKAAPSLAPATPAR